MRFRSLQFRLLFSAGIILAIAFAVMALVLEQGFRKSAEQALQERLQVQIYALLSVAELLPNGRLKISDEFLHEPRLATPGSGLYAFVHKKNGVMIWRSASALGLKNSLNIDPKPGESLFVRQLDEPSRFALQYDIIWEGDSGKEYEFIITIAEEARFLDQQIETFRQTLYYWLLIFAVFFLIILFAVIRWGLRPLREIGNDLHAIEQGEIEFLKGSYSSELQLLAHNLNGLINSERAHLTRYRNTLADLAHSLKTPLAILRGCLEAGDKIVSSRETIQNQVDRMNDIVEYQLQSAAAKGQKQISGRIVVLPVLEKIIHSLEKVYGNKNIRFELAIPEHFSMCCDEGDFYEIAGNLLDNACKWCKSKIKITIPNNCHYNYSCLSIEDDGPGIALENLDNILKRGVRADQNIDGHGIGLAVVNELVNLMGGTLKGEKSQELGGMKWVISIEQRCGE